MSSRSNMLNNAIRFFGEGMLFIIASLSFLAVLFIFYFICRDAFPFFGEHSLKEFFTNKNWYPSSSPAIFGAFSIIWGTFLVTLGAAVIAIPLGVIAAVCLSDLLPFKVRQLMKPVIEILAAIPSVAYGFFALVIFAPFLQDNGNAILQVVIWVVLTPIAIFIAWWLAERLVSFCNTHFEICEDEQSEKIMKIIFFLFLSSIFILGIAVISFQSYGIEIASGTNAFNVSIILGIMALPTVVSLSEDALQSVPKEIREGSFALGATKAETIVKVILPAAASGILAAIVLGMMRVIGETMVVWMASGNSAQMPWFDYFEPIRTLTATIAGEMGEADQTTGSARYHVLFVMALLLLSISFIMNSLSGYLASRRKKRGR